MGVARLLRSRYVSEPQIDIEQQWARARVPAPVTFDFPSLDEGFEKNNYTLERVRVRTDVAVRDDEVKIVATGQTFRLRGEAADLFRRDVLRRPAHLGFGQLGAQGHGPR